MPAMTTDDFSASGKRAKSSRRRERSLHDLPSDMQACRSASGDDRQVPWAVKISGRAGVGEAVRMPARVLLLQHLFDVGALAAGSAATCRGGSREIDYWLAASVGKTTQRPAAMSARRRAGTGMIPPRIPRRPAASLKDRERNFNSISGWTGGQFRTIFERQTQDLGRVVPARGAMLASGQGDGRQAGDTAGRGGQWRRGHQAAAAAIRRAFPKRR